MGARSKTVMLAFYAKLNCARFCLLGPIALLLCCTGLAQKKSPDSNAFSIRTQSLPNGLINAHYQFQLQAQRGATPYHWALASGPLPQGLDLTPDGMLEGVPTKIGEFHFVIAAADSSHPPSGETRKLVLKVIAPLLARWERYPKINGQRIEGSVKVSNDTDRDFELTFIVLAVNDIGRAQALGYQHFSLRKNTTGFEIPFGDNVPRGSYTIHADVVAEVAATDSIHRARLDTREKLAVQTGP